MSKHVEAEKKVAITVPKTKGDCRLNWWRYPRAGYTHKMAVDSCLKDVACHVRNDFHWFAICVGMISIKPKKRWFSYIFITITMWQLPQNKAPKLKTERNQAHMSTLLKSDIEAENQCLWKEKDLHQTKHQVWGWLFVFWDEMTPLADFQLNVSSQNGCWARMPSQFSVSLTSQRALRHSHWCVKKPAFFCILRCQFVICRRSLSFSRSFFQWSFLP